jgi:hypothetical protein
MAEPDSHSSFWNKYVRATRSLGHAQFHTDTKNPVYAGCSTVCCGDRRVGVDFA